MQLSPKKARILNEALVTWRETDVISEEEFQKLKNSYKVMSFNWKRLAKYSFQLATFCIIISISSILAEQWLTDLLRKLFDISALGKSLLLALLSTILYFLGITRKTKSPNKTYSNEAIFFLGVITTALSIMYLASSLDMEHFSILLLLTAIIYGVLGLWFPSKLVWLFSLLSLGSWFGVETGYASGWGAYFFGMNYPLRFVVFGLVLIFCGSYLFNQWKARRAFLKTTKTIGLLYLFIALWIMSIFGNCSDIDAWWEIGKTMELFYWSILFALVAMGAIYHGVKYDDEITRGFGLTFIFINLYTRFFEYFWEGTHKALFFAILALSFWYLGSKAEKIWQLNIVKKLFK
jgi:hypothetical protein